MFNLIFSNEEFNFAFVLLDKYNKEFEFDQSYLKLEVFFVETEVMY